MNLKKEEYPILLKPSVIGVEENLLSMLSYTVLSAFIEGKLVKDVVREVTNNFESVSGDEKKKIQNIVIQQIKEYLVTGILMEY